MGCTSNSVYICTDDGQCPDGRCEPVGYCSFPDDDCASGWVYGELAAPTVAGMCVGDEVSDGSGPPGTTGATSSATSASPSTSTLPSTSMSSEPPADDDSGSSFTTAVSVDMGPDPVVPDICLIYAEQVTVCSGKEEGQYAEDYCVEYYHYYADYGAPCLELFTDLMVCLSNLDCKQLMSGGAAEHCPDELMVLLATC